MMLSPCTKQRFFLASLQLTLTVSSGWTFVQATVTDTSSTGTASESTVECKTPAESTPTLVISCFTALLAGIAMVLSYYSFKQKDRELEEQDRRARNPGFLPEKINIDPALLSPSTSAFIKRSTAKERSALLRELRGQDFVIQAAAGTGKRVYVQELVSDSYFHDFFIGAYILSSGQVGSLDALLNTMASDFGVLELGHLTLQEVKRRVQSQLALLSPNRPMLLVAIKLTQAEIQAFRDCFQPNVRFLATSREVGALWHGFSTLPLPPITKQTCSQLDAAILASSRSSARALTADEAAVLLAPRGSTISAITASLLQYRGAVFPPAIPPTLQQCIDAVFSSNLFFFAPAFRLALQFLARMSHSQPVLLPKLLVQTLAEQESLKDGNQQLRQGLERGFITESGELFILDPIWSVEEKTVPPRDIREAAARLLLTAFNRTVLPHLTHSKEGREKVIVLEPYLRHFRTSVRAISDPLTIQDLYTPPITIETAAEVMRFEYLAAYARTQASGYDDDARTQLTVALQGTLNYLGLDVTTPQPAAISFESIWQRLNLGVMNLKAEPSYQGGYWSTSALFFAASVVAVVYTYGWQYFGAKDKSKFPRGLFVCAMKFAKILSDEFQHTTGFLLSDGLAIELKLAQFMTEENHFSDAVEAATVLQGQDATRAFAFVAPRRFERLSEESAKFHPISCFDVIGHAHLRQAEFEKSSLAAKLAVEAFRLREQLMKEQKQDPSQIKKASDKLQEAETISHRLEEEEKKNHPENKIDDVA